MPFYQKAYINIKIISYEDDKKLQAVMEKVEENIPDLIFDKEQPEQEDSHGIQPD